MAKFKVFLMAIIFKLICSSIGFFCDFLKFCLKKKNLPVMEAKINSLLLHSATVVTFSSPYRKVAIKIYLLQK